MPFFTSRHIYLGQTVSFGLPPRSIEWYCRTKARYHASSDFQGDRFYEGGYEKAKEDNGMAMKKPALVFLAGLLALTALLPMATAADRGRAAVTPVSTSVTFGDATPTPDGASTVCVDVSAVDQAAGYGGGFEGREAGGTPDPQAAEQFRRELSGLLDELEQLSDMLPSHSAYRSDAKYALKQARRQLPHFSVEQLYLMQKSFKDIGADLGALKSTMVTVKTEALAVRRADAREESESKPGSDSPPADVSLVPGGEVDSGKGERGPAPRAFPSIPTPTPDRTGISHDGDDQDDLNDDLDDLFPPPWPTDVGCPKQGYSTGVMFGLMVGIDVLKGVQIALDTWCKEKTITCPGSNPQDPAGCWVAAGSKFILNVTEDVRDGFAYCNGNVASARIETIFNNTRILHKELHEHDQNLIERNVATDEFLFNFRDLNLRLNIEANLASPDDNPHVLLALPRQFCVSSDLEELTANPKNANYDPFAPEALAGCGLLEVVSDTVKSTIDMMQSTNLSVNNAEAERQAALEHYNNEEWKKAFDRFRKAYREAVRDTKR